MTEKRPIQFRLHIFPYAASVNLVGDTLREYVLYFPLYNLVNSLSVTLDENAVVERGNPYRDNVLNHSFHLFESEKRGGDNNVYFLSGKTFYGSVVLKILRWTVVIPPIMVLR